MISTVCYFGTYESGYERNRILQAALRACGVRVLTVHAPLLEARRHKTGALGRRLALAGLGARALGAYARLAARYLAAPDHDAVFVGYLGHLDVLVAAPLARLRGKPLIFDAFISLSDTLVEDRQVLAPGSLGARAAALLDRLACGLADVVLADTDAHARYFVEAHGAPPARTLRVLVGADPALFHPVAPPPPTVDFVVLHYSKLAPLHGLRTILEAAKRLEGEPGVRFLIVGEGQLDDALSDWLAELAPANVERRRWMEPDELRSALASAGAALGVFGASAKAARVVPNKLYQAMAVGAPIVTADTPGVREVLAHERDALLVPPGDPEALAAAILRLRDEAPLRARLAANARARFEALATPEAIGRALLDELARVLPSEPALTARRPCRSPDGSASARPSGTTARSPR
ncbi:MAG: glycosyltransferase [Sandaracinaceae bacterium]|nr:glycosyltransferase [Sandaracinaceae bacterium]